MGEGSQHRARCARGFEAQQEQKAAVAELMQIMHDKKLLTRNESSRSHVYTANISQQKTQGQLVKKFIDNVFNGSASQLVLQALGNHKVNRQELDEIKQLLAEMEKKMKNR